MLTFEPVIFDVYILLSYLNFNIKLTDIYLPHTFYVHKIILMKKFLSLIFTTTMLFSGFSQSKQITGSVYDAVNNQPIPGATVLVKETGLGSVTDFDGMFTIPNVSLNSSIEISYIGFETQMITITDFNDLIIKLEAKAESLNEVVVTGYGSQRRSNIVGSVATVDVKKAAQLPTTNVTELLRGRAAGVQVNLNDARPGGSSSIVIRGNVSVAGGNNPLIIVDGLPYDSLNDIAPDDIQSIEILKDAASTAIYGARASNGVILVTTKKARDGYSSFNYAGYATIQKLTRNFDVYKGKEFYDYRLDAFRARFGVQNPPANYVWNSIELDLIENNNYVDWEDLALTARQRKRLLRNIAKQVCGRVTQTEPEHVLVWTG